MIKNLKIGLLCILLASCNPNSQVISIDKKSDSATCIQPGAELAAAGYNLDANTKFKTKEILTASVKIDRKIERLRTEVPNVNTLKEINFIMCVAHAQGHLSDVAYENFLTDVASRLPKDLTAVSAKIEPCGDKDVPCVNISRKADFTQSTCAEGGKKKDLAVFNDTYSLNSDSKIYQARAQTRGDTKIEVYDLNNSTNDLLPPAKKECVGGNNICDYRWNLIVNAKTHTAKAKYVITNGHSGNREGLGFWSNYKIRDIAAEMKFPEGVEIENKTFSPEDITGKNCLTQKNTCENLYTNDQVNILWDWNIWKKCS